MSQENCHISRAVDEGDIKLGLVTRLDKKKTDASFDVIVIFP